MVLGLCVTPVIAEYELNQQSSNNQSNESEVIARLKTEARDAQEKLNKAEMEKKRLIEEARQV
jgi:hypothetical protein